MGNIKRDYTLIHYVISGKGTVKIEGESYEVSARQAFIIPEGVENSYSADDNDPWSYIWIGFNGKLSHRFKKLPPVINTNGNIFFEMMDVENMHSMQEEYLVQKLFKLYISLFPETTSLDYARIAANYIDLNFRNPDITVESVAAVLNIERSYLTRLFKEKKGKTIREYILDTRMNNAITLLQSGLSVQETARQIGYTDPFVFSKAFKKHMGESPKAYKHRT
jgi:AraC-like DNA-binding protein